MFSAFASFLSNFVPKNDSPLEMKDIENAFENAIQINVPESIAVNDCWNEEGCFYKTGVITAVRDDYVLLDNKYVCDIDNVAVTVKVGDKVEYLAYQLDRNKEQKIRKIMSLCDSTWDEECQESATRAEPTIKGQMMDRTIVGKVMKREERVVFVEPHNVSFNLDNVRSEFIPVVGDWVNINSLVEIREDAADLIGEVLEIESVRPARSKLQTGNVTSYNLTTGVGTIDRNTVFTKVVCEPGYIPCVGDRVVTDSIESDQGTFVWRSLTVVPLNQGLQKNPIALKPECADGAELEKEKEMGLIITKDLEFSLEIQEERELTIKIQNMGDYRQTLVKCCFLSKKAESQLILISPKIDEQIILKPGDEISYIFRCKAKFMGLSVEKFLFIFQGFKVIRSFRLLGKAKQTASGRVTNCVNKNIPARQDVHDDNGYIHGIRPCKPPAFIAVRSGIFKIPQKYWNVVLEAENNRNTQAERQFLVGEEIPCLVQSLTMQNYRERFHGLLYLEEIAQTLCMQKYDIESVSLTHCGEYLSLRVPGLAEKRPSLITGDRAIVSFKWDSSKGNLKYEGFVHKVKSTDVLLQFNPQFHADYCGEDCQVSFKGSNTTIRRCHDAVNLAVTHLGPAFLFPNKVVQKPPQFFITEIEEKDLSKSCPSNHKRNGSIVSNSTTTSNPDFLVEGVKSPPRVSVAERLFNTKSFSSPFDRNGDKPEFIRSCNDNRNNNKANSTEKNFVDYEAELKKRKLIWYNKRLNYYQKKAVLNILKGLARPLPYVIFGPPGTGKTITLCEAVLQIVTTISESRLLIATPSNSSANLITERLLNSEVLKPGDLVRLVAQHCLEEGTIPERLLPYCATGQLQEERSGSNMKTHESGFKTNCTASVLGRHRITIGTCSAVGLIYNMGLSRGHFTHVLVDEAGQATEPEILIPLTFIHADGGQVILAGDPMQLGPVVQSNLATHFGLGESFLSRLLQQFPYQRDPEGFETGLDPRLVTKLLMNYRSLPEILQLPNSLFYDSELIPQISSTRSDEAKLLDTLAPDLPERTGLPPSIVFHGVNGNNYQLPDSPSWYNPEEATQVYFYLLKLYSRGVDPNDIGIITPYQSQVRQIRDLLMELEIEIPKVGSVEEFQGQERSVIILSTVRSMTDYVAEDVRCALGFVAAPRRLNVAITRARALLIIIGNPYLLSEDPYWRAVLKYCLERDAYTGCSVSNAFRERTDLDKELGESD